MADARRVAGFDTEGLVEPVEVCGDVVEPMVLAVPVDQPDILLLPQQPVHFESLLHRHFIGKRVVTAVLMSLPKIIKLGELSLWCSAPSWVR